MNTRFVFMGIACILLAGYGCTPKQEKTATFDEYEKPDTVSGIQQMKNYHYSAEVKAKDALYTYDIVRDVNDSLPTIKGDDNHQFADNFIHLRVNKEGKEIFNKVFTKKHFAAQLDKDFLQHSMLEGMAFDCMRPEGLRFSVSISYPESDIYMPFSVLITPEGGYKITKEDILDTVVETDSVKEP